MTITMASSISRESEVLQKGTSLNLMVEELLDMVNGEV